MMESDLFLEMKTKYQRTICPAVEIGKLGGCRRFYIDITLEDGRLSMYGSWRSHGQNADDLTNESLTPIKGFEYSDVLKIQSIWKRWHLNDMRAGTPKQEDFIREWKLTHKYDYTKACEALAEVGLLYDNGYKYGSSWLKEELPAEIIKYLFTLPAISGASWFDIEPIAVDEADFLNILQVGATNQ